MKLGRAGWAAAAVLGLATMAQSAAAKITTITITLSGQVTANYIDDYYLIDGTHFPGIDRPLGPFNGQLSFNVDTPDSTPDSAFANGSVVGWGPNNYQFLTMLNGMVQSGTIHYDDGADCSGGINAHFSNGNFEYSELFCQYVPGHLAFGYPWSRFYASGRVTAYAVNGITVPEPTTWTLMIGGFGLAGAALRRRRAAVAA